MGHGIVTDLTVSTHQLDSHTWQRLEKELYLHISQTSKQQAWVYVKILDEGQISEDDLVITDLTVGSCPDTSGSCMGKSTFRSLGVKK